MKDETKKDNTFVERVSEIQAKLKAPKGQFNAFGKYSYRSCEDILEGLKPLLNGLILTVSDDIVMVGERVYIKATASLTDGNEAINNSAFAREPLSKKGMDESQITGTASSYARKYALNGLFCIDDTKDADSQDNSPMSKPQGASVDRFAKKDSSGAPADFMVSFGKYNGKQLKEIDRQELIDYCKYIKSNNDDPKGKMKELLDKSRELMRQAT
jgi:uncharacterized protein (DUF3820 family)